VLNLGGKIWSMTLARTERSENFSAALKIMLDGIGDAPLDEVPFAPSAHPDILNTTWDELLATELMRRCPRESTS
jgi:hypothetical protein